MQTRYGLMLLSTLLLSLTLFALCPTPAFCQNGCLLVEGATDNKNQQQNGGVADKVTAILDKLREARIHGDVSTEDSEEEIASYGDYALEALEQEWEKPDDLVIKTAIVHALALMGTQESASLLVRFYRQPEISVKGQSETTRRMAQTFAREAILSGLQILAISQKAGSVRAMKFLYEEYASHPGSQRRAIVLGRCHNSVSRAALVRMFLIGNADEKVAAVYGLAQDSRNTEVSELLKRSLPSLTGAVRRAVISIAHEFEDKDIDFFLGAMLLLEDDKAMLGKIIRGLGSRRCLMVAPALAALTQHNDRELSLWACAAMYQLQLEKQRDRLEVFRMMVRWKCGADPPKFLREKGPKYWEAWWKYVGDIIYKNSEPPTDDKGKAIYSEAKQFVVSLLTTDIEFHLLVAASGVEFSAKARELLAIKIKNKLPEKGKDILKWYMSNQPYLRRFSDGTLRVEPIAAELKVSVNEILSYASNEKIDWDTLSDVEKRSLAKRVKVLIVKSRSDMEEAWAAGMSLEMWQHIPDTIADKWKDISDKEKQELIAEAEKKLLEELEARRQEPEEQ